MREAPRRRRIGLTPMIDVVFLLLIFFMLAARFGQEGAITISLAEGGGAVSGPPRLVDVTPDEVRLNGVETSLDALPGELQRLLESDGDVFVLRANEGADVQRLVDVLGALSSAGLTGGTILE